MKTKLCLLAVAFFFSGPAFADQPPLPGFSYTNITTDATTTVKTGAGVLHAICVNTPAATETIQIYDNTAASGTTIGKITSFASLPGCFNYDIAFSTGLTVVTAVAAGDVTVSWR